MDIEALCSDVLDRLVGRTEFSEAGVIGFLFSENGNDVSLSFECYCGLVWVTLRFDHHAISFCVENTCSVDFIVDRILFFAKELVARTS